MEDYVELMKKKIQNQVERFRELGLADSEIVRWLENEVHQRINLTCYFQSVEELAHLMKLPVLLEQASGSFKRAFTDEKP